jgi:hypothetical protein
VELPAELRAALIVHVGSDLAGWELIRPYVQNVVLALGSQVEILVSVAQMPEAESGVGFDGGCHLQKDLMPFRCDGLRLRSNSDHWDDLQEAGTAPQGGHVEGT